MSASSAAVLADSPDAYLRLDETGAGPFLDSSGNSRSASLSGGSTTIVSATSLIPSDANAAAKFDWGGTLKQADTSYAFGPTNFTIECWVNLSSLSLDSGASGYYVGIGVNLLLGSSNAGGTNGWAFGIASNGTQVYFAHQGVGEAFASTTVTTNTSYHFAIVGSGAFNRDLYKDGAFVSTITPGGAGMITPTGGFVLNNGAPGSNTNPRCATNALDEVAIYPTALAAERILAHYNAAVGRAPARDTKTAIPFTQGAGGGGLRGGPH